jgi:hypothetical protein
MAFVFWSVAFSAHAVGPCLSVLTAVPIPRTIKPRNYSIEMAAAGHLTGPRELLPRFMPGFYIYLITDHEEILVANKYNIEDDKGLATHKSLLNMYRNVTGNSAVQHVVAAGEFQMVFDDVLEIKNKSGNFRGDRTTLLLAEQTLARHGLPVSGRTRLTAIGSGVEDHGHTPAEREFDEFHLEILRQVYGSERGRQLVSLYTQMEALLRMTFPKLRGIETLKAMIGYQTEGAKRSGVYDGLQVLYYPLQQLYSTDGMEHGIWSTEQDEDVDGPDGFKRGVPAQIENFIAAMGAAMPASMRTEWRALGERFRGLKD